MVSQTFALFSMGCVFNSTPHSNCLTDCAHLFMKPVSRNIISAILKVENLPLISAIILLTGEVLSKISHTIHLFLDELQTKIGPDASTAKI